MSRTVFLGTSDFAATVLRRLGESAHRPLLAVTPPDRKQGRGRRLHSPPAAVVARELDLPLLQVESVNDAEALRQIRATASDVAAVCAFGQLIREPLLSELEMLNVHPSLLPRWRGAAPIERAILAGDEQTGVCVMWVTEGLDSGPVALRESTPIESGEDFGSLSRRLAGIGGELIVRALDLREAGELEYLDQDDADATYAEKIGSAERRLDPARPAEQLARQVRALTPHIGAYLEAAGGDRLGVRAATPAPGSDQPGRLRREGEQLWLGCGEGRLRLDRVQPAGGRPMSAADYVRGHQLPDRMIMQNE